MLDPQDELYDERLARHLVSLYYNTNEERDTEFLVSKSFRFKLVLLLRCAFKELDVLRDYIAYGKEHEQTL